VTNSWATSVAGLKIHRWTIAACFVFLRKISRSALDRPAALQTGKAQCEHMFSELPLKASASRAGGSPITSRSGSEKVSMRRYAWVIWPTPISRSAHRPDSGQDGREPCLSGVPRHSQDSRRAHRSCLPDAWNRILEIRIRYQRRRMTLRRFSQVTSASVPSRESREVLHYFQYQHWCRELAVARG